MSKQLIEKLRRDREIRVPLPDGRRAVTALRPTDLEMMGVNRLTGEDQVRRALEFVIGWENFTEDDLVGGASMDPVKFDADLWRAWAADSSDTWVPIAEAIFKAYEAKVGAEAQAVKN